MGSSFIGDSTIYYGTVSVEGDVNSLRIVYRSGGQVIACGSDSVFGAHIEPQVNENGSLSYERLTRCSVQSNFNGSFTADDSLKFAISSGGGSFTNGQVVKGKKLN